MVPFFYRTESPKQTTKKRTQKELTRTSKGLFNSVCTDCSKRNTLSPTAASMEALLLCTTTLSSFFSTSPDSSVWTPRSRRSWSKRPRITVDTRCTRRSKEARALSTFFPLNASASRFNAAATPRGRRFALTTVGAPRKAPLLTRAGESMIPSLESRDQPSSERDNNETRPNERAYLLMSSSASIRFRERAFSKHVSI